VTTTLAPALIADELAWTRHDCVKSRQRGWWLPLALSFAGGAVIIAALPWIDPTTEGTTGLISAAGPQYVAGVVLLSSGFVTALLFDDVPRWLLGCQVVAFVVLVVGLGALVEPAPRLAITYTHLGFAQYIGSHGTALPPIDARAGWPGAFSLIAVVESWINSSTGFVIGRWAPLLFDLLAIAPLFVLTGVVTEDRRARWLAIWIFFAANWVEQDYLSPQALAFTMYLTVIGTVLAVFGSRPSVGRKASGAIRSIMASAQRRLSIHSWHPHTPLARALPAATRAVLLASVVAIGAAMTMSHQLTPYVLILDIAALALIGRTRLGTLAWLLVLMAIAWLSFGASSFWSGHLGLLTGSAGNVAGNVSAGVSGRLRGDPGHLLVLWSRIAIVVALMATAALGLLRLWVRHAEQLWVAVLAGVPIVLIGFQSYGGEVVIRTYFFALPFLAILSAAAIFPGRGRVPRTARHAGTRTTQSVRQRIGIGLERCTRATGRLSPSVRVVAIAGIVASASLLGLVAHYGADQSEQVGVGELTALTWFYAHVPPQSDAFTACVNLPWRSEGAASFRYKTLVSESYGRPLKELRRLLSPERGAYFIASKSQEVCGEQQLGLAPGWLASLEASLSKAEHATLIYSADGARIYRLAPHEPTTRPRSQ